MARRLRSGSRVLLLLVAAAALVAVGHACDVGKGGKSGSGHTARRLLGVSQWAGSWNNGWNNGWDSWNGGRRFDRWGNWNNPWSGGWVARPIPPTIPDNSRFDDGGWW